MKLRLKSKPSFQKLKEALRGIKHLENCDYFNEFVFLDCKKEEIVENLFLLLNLLKQLNLMEEVFMTTSD